MKILFQEDYDDSQDDFLEEKQKIIDCPFSLHDLRSLPEILMWWLEIRVFRNEEDYFNLRLWIDVLNKIDSAMDLIIRTLSARAEILESTNKIGNSSSQQSPAGDCDSDNGFATDQDLISAAKILIKWTSSFLSCSCNKIVFNSVDRLFLFLQCGHEEISFLSLDAILKLVVCPPNHLNVAVFDDTSTVVQNCCDYLSPLYDILTSWRKTKRLSIQQFIEDSSHHQASRNRSENDQGCKFTADVISRCNHQGIPLSTSRTFFNTWWKSLFARDVFSGMGYVVALRCISIILISDHKIDKISDFFEEDSTLQHDMIFILRYLNQQNENDVDLDPEVSLICSLALDCMRYIANASENHYSDGEERPRFISPFHSILQVKLGIDSSQEFGLLPAVLRQELMWLCNLMLRTSESVDTSTSLQQLRRDIFRLQRLDLTVLLCMFSLSLPKSITTFVSYGILDGVLAVISSNQLTISYNSIIAGTFLVKSDLNKEDSVDRHNLMRSLLLHLIGIESALVQMADMIVCTKHSAMDEIFRLNGPCLILRKLQSEAESFTELCAQHTGTTKSTFIPSCMESRIFSLTAIAGSFLNYNSESNFVFEQIETVKNCVRFLCKGFALWSIPIFTKLMDILVDLIEEDPTTLNKLNSFYEHNIIRDIWIASNELKVSVDGEFLLSYLDFLNSITVSEKTTKFLKTVNPFNLVFGIYEFSTNISQLTIPQIEMQKQRAFSDCTLFEENGNSELGDRLRISFKSKDYLNNMGAAVASRALGAIVSLIKDVADNKSPFFVKKIYGIASGQEVRVLRIAMAYLVCLNRMIDSVSFLEEFSRRCGILNLCDLLSASAKLRGLHGASIACKQQRQNHEDFLSFAEFQSELIGIFAKICEHDLERREMVFNAINDQIRGHFKLYQSAAEKYRSPGSCHSSEVSYKDALMSERVADTASFTHLKKRSRVVGTPNSSLKKKQKPITKYSAQDQESESGFNLKSFTHHRTDSLDEFLEFLEMPSASMSSLDLSYAEACYAIQSLGSFLDVFSNIVSLSGSGAGQLTISLSQGIMELAFQIQHAVTRDIVDSVTNKLSRKSNVLVDTKDCDVALDFLVYLPPQKKRITVYSEVPSPLSKESYPADGYYITENSGLMSDCFVLACEKICDDSTLGLTYFRLSDGAGFIRREKIDDHYNTEVVGIAKSNQKHQHSNEFAKNLTCGTFVDSILWSLRRAADLVTDRIARRFSTPRKVLVQKLSAQLSSFQGTVDECNSAKYLILFNCATKTFLSYVLRDSDSLRVASFISPSLMQFFEIHTKFFGVLLRTFCSKDDSETNSIRQLRATALSAAILLYCRFFSSSISFDNVWDGNLTAILGKLVPNLSLMSFSNKSYIPSVIIFCLLDLFSILVRLANRIIQEEKEKKIKVNEKFPCTSKLLRVVETLRFFFFVHFAFQNEPNTIDDLPNYLLLEDLPDSRRKIPFITGDPDEFIFLLIDTLKKPTVTTSTKSLTIPEVGCKNLVSILTSVFFHKIHDKDFSNCPVKELQNILSVVNSLLLVGITEPFGQAIVFVVTNLPYFKQLIIKIIEKVTSLPFESENYKWLVEAFILIDIFMQPILVTKHIKNCVATICETIVSMFSDLEMVFPPSKDISYSDLRDRSWIQPFLDTIEVAIDNDVSAESLAGVAASLNFTELSFRRNSAEYVSCLTDVCFHFISLLEGANGFNDHALEKTVLVLLGHLARCTDGAAMILRPDRINVLLGRCRRFKFKAFILGSILTTAIEQVCPSLLVEKMGNTLLTISSDNFFAIFSDEEKCKKYFPPTEFTEKRFLGNITEDFIPLLIRSPALLHSCLQSKSFCLHQQLTIFALRGEANNSRWAAYLANTLEFAKLVKEDDIAIPPESLSHVAETIAQCLSTTIQSSIDQINGPSPSFESYEVLSDVLIVCANIVQSLPSRFVDEFENFFPKGFVHEIFRKIVTLFDVDVLCTFWSLYGKEILGKQVESKSVPSSMHKLYGSTTYCLLAFVSLEGPNRLSFIEVLSESLLGALSEFNNVPEEHVLAKNNNAVRVVLVALDFINSISNSSTIARFKSPFAVPSNHILASFASSKLYAIMHSLQQLLLTKRFSFLPDSTQSDSIDLKSLLINRFSSAFISIVHDGATDAKKLLGFYNIIQPNLKKTNFESFIMSNAYEVANDFFHKLEKPKISKPKPYSIIKEEVATDVIREEDCDVFICGAAESIKHAKWLDAMQSSAKAITPVANDSQVPPNEPENASLIPQTNEIGHLQDSFTSLRCGDSGKKVDGKQDSNSGAMETCSGTVPDNPPLVCASNGPWLVTRTSTTQMTNIRTSYGNGVLRTKYSNGVAQKPTIFYGQEYSTGNYVCQDSDDDDDNDDEEESNSDDEDEDDDSEEDDEDNVEEEEKEEEEEEEEEGDNDGDDDDRGSGNMEESGFSVDEDDEDDESDDFTDASDTDEDDTQFAENEEDEIDRFTENEDDESDLNDSVPNVFELLDIIPKQSESRHFDYSGSLLIDISKSIPNCCLQPRMSQFVRSDRSRDRRVSACPRRWGTDLDSTIKGVFSPPLATYFSALLLIPFLDMYGKQPLETEIDSVLQEAISSTYAKENVTYGKADSIREEMVSMFGNCKLLGDAVNIKDEVENGAELCRLFVAYLKTRSSDWDSNCPKSYSALMETDKNLKHFQQCLDWMYGSDRRTLGVDKEMLACFADWLNCSNSVELDIFKVKIIRHQCLKMYWQDSSYDSRMQRSLCVAIFVPAEDSLFHHILRLYIRIAAGATLSEEHLTSMLALIQQISQFYKVDKALLPIDALAPEVDPAIISTFGRIFLSKRICDIDQVVSTKGSPLYGEVRVLPPVFRDFMMILCFLMNENNNWLPSMSVLFAIGDVLITEVESDIQDNLRALECNQNGIEAMTPSRNSFLRLQYFVLIIKTATIAMIKSCGRQWAANNEKLKFDAQLSRLYGQPENGSKVDSYSEVIRKLRSYKLFLFSKLQSIRRSSAWSSLTSVLRVTSPRVKYEAHSNDSSHDESVMASVKAFMDHKVFDADVQRSAPLISCLFQVSGMHSFLFNDQIKTLEMQRRKHFKEMLKTESQTPHKLDSSVLDSSVLISPPPKGYQTLAEKELFFDDIEFDHRAKSRTSIFDCDDNATSESSSQKEGSFDNIVTCLYAITEEKKKYINAKLSQNIRLLETDFQPLLHVTDLTKYLDFSVKRKYLKILITRLKRAMKFVDMDERTRPLEVGAAQESGHLGIDESITSEVFEEDSEECLSICVDRQKVLEQSFQFINEIPPRVFLRSPIEITFNDEEGIDSGGLYREWYSILTRSIFSPNYMLFSLASDGVTYQLNAQSGVNPEHLKYFRFIGRLIAKAICDNQLMDVHFTKPFYKHMLGLPISFSDLAVLDPAYHQSLSALLACPLVDLGMDGPLHSLSFSVDQNIFGMEECEDLIPNGRNVLVTDENKHEYVRLLAQHRLTASSKLQLDSFLEGFREVLPASCLEFFDPSELELLISGLPEIDIEDLSMNTTYTGYTAKDDTIRHLWNVLHSFTAEEKALFLQFVTGTCKVPLDGFRSLQGSEGVQKFSVHKAYNKTQLPMAHTCFNQLDLPEYDSEEMLREKLLIAIREGSEGFGMS